VNTTFSKARDNKLPIVHAANNGLIDTGLSPVIRDLAQGSARAARRLDQRIAFAF
jgi:hypothetical protein